MSMKFLGVNPSKMIGDITGANAAAKGAENAAGAQIQAATQANDLQKYMYDTTRNDLAPYRQIGAGALGQMSALMGLDAYGQPTNAPVNYSAFTNSPGYQFAMNQGLQGVQRQLAAGGRSASGAGLKAANQYAQDYASQGFGQFYNRLAGLAGQGQQATDTTGQFGANYATQAGNNLVDMGNARGSAYIARGNVGATNFNNMMKMAGTAASAMSGSAGGGSGAGASSFKMFGG